MSMSAYEKDRLYTRRSGSELIREKRGVRIPPSRIDKDCMAGTGPLPQATYGNRFLYTEEELLRYADRLIKPIEQIKNRAA